MTYIKAQNESFKTFQSLDKNMTHGNGELYDQTHAGPKFLPVQNNSEQRFISSTSDILQS